MDLWDHCARAKRKLHRQAHSIDLIRITVTTALSYAATNAVLKPTANIAVIAPAGIPKQPELERGIALLEDWGYRVVTGNHLRSRHRYNAGSVAERSTDLNWALTSPDIDAVWLARGGYGCVHCLSSLPSELPNRRMLIGNSDATSLLSALYRRGYTNLIHGPMLESLAGRVDEETRDSMLRLLRTPVAPAMPVEQLSGPAESLSDSLGSLSGPLIGGNLTVLASIVGTPWAMSAGASIVLLEDVGEAAYRLDRSMTQLIMSGALSGARAVVFGEFVRCPVPETDSFSIEDMMRDLLRPLDIPVFFGGQFGHGSRNLPWRYGALATIGREELSLLPGG